MRIKILEKLILAGYDNDKKIAEMNIENLILNNDFNRLELETIIRIKQAILNKNIISFISGKEKEEK